MSMKKGGPLEVVCDAPSYPIVQACSMIGLERPEDVRWWKVTHFLAAHGYALPDCRGASWTQLLQAPRPKPLTCPCGRELPPLTEYRFTFNDGTHADYSLGQCGRCKTVYWHEA